MSMNFRPAVRTQTPILLGLAGPSRSGKTYSALRIATGLAQGQPIFMIDTESGRGLMYAEKFTYQYGELAAPFTSERYLQAIEDAKAAGAKVIIVDSMSHEHEGPGGMLEQHDANLDRMAGNDFKKRKQVTFTAWIQPKKSHNAFVNRLLQMGADTHFIFCFRAKDKLLIKKGQEPVSMGWTPICSSRFEFEMTSLLVLPEGSKGAPDLEATASGLREPLDTMIRAGTQLDESVGKRLAEWSTSGAKTKSAASTPADPPALITPDQIAAIETRCQDHGIPLADVKEAASVSELAAITAKRYSAVMKWIDAEIDAKQAA